MYRRVMIGILVAALVACTSVAKRVVPDAGSWFIKEGAPASDHLSRKLLVGKWHSESTDVHSVEHIEDSVLEANGTYVFHFIAMSETGAVTTDQTECGLWGVSGDIYFTITQATRSGDKGERVSPYSATYYDAYRIASLTATAFEYEHVVTKDLMRFNKFGGSETGQTIAQEHATALSPCLGAST